MVHDEILLHRFCINDISSVRSFRILFLYILTKEFCQPKFETLAQLRLPIERTTVISTCLAEKDRILICGSRESALLVYELPVFDGQSVNSIAPIMQLRRSHGKEAVSSISIKPTDDPSCLTFWTTGRDGSYVQYRLARQSQNKTVLEHTDNESIALGIASRGDTTVASHGWVLEKVYRNKVTKGWLERAIWIDGELLLLGFYRKRCFIYNVANNYEVIR